MATVKFTAGRINGFQCESGKHQSFLWDSAAPGLGLRATLSGAKSYIFQAKLNGKAIRITIGAPATWAIDQAQAEARRLKVVIDNGQDPRQQKADKLAAAIAAATEAELAALRNSATLGSVWPQYVTERRPQWSDHHYADHIKIIQMGGDARARSAKLTEPGPLASLTEVRLADLDTLRIEAWARIETVKRPAYARLAWRMLKAFLTWCAAHPDYAGIVQANAAISKKTRESLGKPSKKNDGLQREQLAAWFAAVRQLGNPVISAYLQALLLTGARREEMAGLKWGNVDFQWHSMTIRDKVEGLRVIPLTPYVAQLLAALPRRNEWVFSSPTAESGRLAEPRIAHIKALTVAGLPHVSLHGLRRSFASLCEWVEVPSGISAQIQGHAPQGVREQNYIRRPLDLLRRWHVKIEAWMLEQAGINFVPVESGLRVIAKLPEDESIKSG
jgi:integrase